MREPRWRTLLRKSISACVAAIEIYNKPTVSHRDETFAMLAVSAWELLLKARLLKEADGDLRSIQLRTPVLSNAGNPTKRFRVERNRAGNPRTISLGEAVHRVSNLGSMLLDPACSANLWSLVELRDNAVHFFNVDTEMSRRAHEVSCACLRNYAAVVGAWFDHDLGDHRFMILPLSFEGAGARALAVPARRSRHAINLITYLDRAREAHPATEGSPYAASIRVETRIVGSRAKDAIQIRLGAGADGARVVLTEEEIGDRWPLDYAALQKRAKARVPGLLFNKAFNTAVRALKDNQQFSFRRRLDPRDPKCKTFKVFYSDAAVDALAKVLSPVAAMPAGNSKAAIDSP